MKLIWGLRDEVTQKWRGMSCQHYEEMKNGKIQDWRAILKRVRTMLSIFTKKTMGHQGAMKKTVLRWHGSQVLHCGDNPKLFLISLLGRATCLHPDMQKVSVLFKTMKEVVQVSQHLALPLYMTRSTEETNCFCCSSWRRRHLHLHGLKETRDRSGALAFLLGSNYHPEEQVTGKIWVLKQNYG